MDQEQNTIFKTLEGFTKAKLVQLGYFMRSGVSSACRKREFLERFCKYLAEKPLNWLCILPETDLRLLKKLVEAGPEVPVFLEYPAFPMILVAFGLIGSDQSGDRVHKTWISKELFDIVSPVIDKAIRRGENDGSFESDQAILGYLSFYGVMTLDELYSCLTEYWEFHCKNAEELFNSGLYDRRRLRIWEFTKRQNIHKVWDMYRESTVGALCTYDIGDTRYMIYPSILDPEAVLSGRKGYSFVSRFHHFSPREALDAAQRCPFFAPGIESESGSRLAEMLDRLGYKGDSLMRAEYDIWVNSQMTADFEGLKGLFRSVSEKEEEIDSFEEYFKCFQIVADFANSVPKWLLRGYSASETSHMKVVLSCSDNEVNAVLIDDPALAFSVPPVAPDEPCPCGSGLSYRLCHGRHLS